MTMIDRIAAKIREIADKVGDRVSDDSSVDIAHAILAEMREPTGEMIAAGVKAWGFDYDATSKDGINDNISNEYRAMIDAALEEK